MRKLLLILLLLSSVIFLTTANINLPEILLNQNETVKKQYILDPQKYSDYHSLIPLPSYPEPKGKLDKTGLFLYNLSAFVSNLSRKNDFLFQAESKIGLLSKWGNQIPILENTKTIKLLYKKNLFSWESIFRDYRQAMEDYISFSKNKTVDSRLLGKLLHEHQNKIESIIFSSNNLKTTKNYLFNTTNSVFDFLSRKHNLSYEEYSPSLIRYELKSITDDKEYGHYQLSINDPRFSSDSIYQVLVDNNPMLKDDILINDKSNTLAISRIADDFFSGNNRFSIATEAGEIIYYQNIYKLKPRDSYYFKLIYHLDSAIKIKFEAFNNDQKDVSSTMIIENTLIPGSRAKTFSTIMEIPQKKNYLYSKFSIIPERKLSNEDLDNVKIFIKKMNEPEIILLKKSELGTKKLTSKKINNCCYSIDTSYTTVNDENKITESLPFWWQTSNRQIGPNYTYQIKVCNWINQLALFIFILSSIGLILSQLLPKLLSFLRINIFKDALKAAAVISSSKVYRIIVFFARKIRFPALIIALIGILSDLTQFFGQVDVFFVIVSLFWLITIIGFGLPAEINYIIALVFLVGSTAVSFFQHDVGAERLAIWLYIFFSFGIMHSLFVLFFNKKSLKTADDITKYFLSHWYLKPLIIVINFFTKVFILFFLLLKKLIGKKPKKPLDYLYFMLRFAVFVIGSFLLINFFIKINNKIVKEQRQLFRLSLNPVITKIEPKTVYYANKVVVFGNQFELKSSSKSRLMTQYGEIPLGRDDWNIHKIYFTVPLHWSVGDINIWVEKPIDWDNKTVIEKSNVFKIRLIPRPEKFTKDDDVYFEQLKHLDKEVLKLNGY